MAKLGTEVALRGEDAAIRAEIQTAATKAVAAAVAQPPRPLSDMRRADEHRTAFVGKRLRETNASLWVGMPATANSAGTPNPGSIPRPGSTETR